MKPLTVEVYKTNARKTPWTWRLKHRNGKIVANAAENYDKPGNARRAALNMGSHLDCRVKFFDATGETYEIIRYESTENQPVPIHAGKEMPAPASTPNPFIFSRQKD